MPLSDALKLNGFFLVEDCLSSAECDDVLAQLSNLKLTGAGCRTLLETDWCQELSRTIRERNGFSSLIPSDFVAVQCTLFDKSPHANWMLKMHQDNAIPVREVVDDPSCSGWSVKDGMTFCIAPPELLETLVAIRIHLDDCFSGNGPLRVIPGSHLLGRNSESISAALKESAEFECEVSRGGAMVMKPLLLHASSKSVNPTSRRVLHFLYGPPNLPCGLNWALAIK